MWHDVVRFGLVRLFYPCLMIFGTIGNILCLKILLRKRFRRQSTCQYLRVLAVIDILFIYMRSSRYLYRYIYNVDLRNRSLWMCRTVIFFSSTLSHLASWILVIVSFDRYFIIKNFFTRHYAGSRVFKCTCILILIVCTVNLHYFHILGTHIVLQVPNFSDDSNETYMNKTWFVCIARTSFKDFFRLYVPIFDLLFVAIIPFCLMIFTNIGIIRMTMRSNMLCKTSKKQQRNNRLTIMLLSVILAFMLLTCPSVIYICLNRLTSSTTVSDTKLLILDLLEALWYTKHALNFILYTLSGQDFRREFIKLISCCHRKTSNTLDRQLENENNNLDKDGNICINSSPFANQRLLRRQKEQQLEEINSLSTMMTAKSLQVKITGNIDGKCIRRTTHSSISTSTNSDPRRSSSTTKTSVQ